jgi:hypothetical protein
MADPWDGIIEFQADGRILIKNTALAEKMKDLLEENNRKMTIYYETNTIPKNDVNMLCVCRAKK